MTAELDDLLHSVRLTEARRRPPERSLTGAAVAGDVDVAAAFLDAGADIEEGSIGFASPLQAAAGAGHLAMVEHLLARGASPRQKENAVYSPLSAAAHHGHLDVVRRLLDALDDLSGETRAVPEAAGAGAADVLRLLLDRGAPLDPHAGHTLRIAAMRGRFACVQLLLESGVDPHRHPDYDRDLFGEPCDPPLLPRQVALDGGHRTVALLLHGKPVSKEKGAAAEARLGPPGAGLQAALAALAGGRRRREEPAEPLPLEGGARVVAIRRILDLLPGLAAAGALDTPGGRGRPPVVMAAEAGHVEVVDALLRHGARVDAAGADGETALLAASRFGHADAVGRLLEGGAAVDHADAERLTPLMLAAARGALDCVRLLLAAGADPDVRVRGRSARGFAFGVHKYRIRAEIEARGGAERS